ncbi:hypothetical protein P8452_70084 [Trifolium repens]|nr:hypothetical protein P8452_70084 [Trifolium repens]
MNTNNSEQLNAAAKAGDIDLLYTVIRNDPSIFERIDSIPFVETPLHISASMGHLQFAIEIMRLKPSFALKLNEQGFSPIHLAMQNGHMTMVSRFVKINKELVRVQGREGITPLHYASQIGEVELLADFLFACPDSIEDVTARDETALHIAVKNEQFEALQVLVGWLKANYEKGARKLELKILNQKDEAGNNILHISALGKEPQTQLLVKTSINLNAKNLENKTALDIATTSEIKKLLSRSRAKSGSKVSDTHTRAHRLRSNTSIVDKVGTFMRRIRRDILDEQRNTWLIVVTLVVTSTFQAALSPPGGVYQVNASENNASIISSNSTISTPKNAGKSVLSKDDFLVFSLTNMLSFLVSTIVIFILTPSGIVGIFVYAPVSWFALCYLLSTWVISPTHANKIIVSIFVYFFGFSWFTCWAIAVYPIFQRICNVKRRNLDWYNR